MEGSSLNRLLALVGQQLDSVLRLHNLICSEAILDNQHKHKQLAFSEEEQHPVLEEQQQASGLQVVLSDKHHKQLQEDYLAGLNSNSNSPLEDYLEELSNNNLEPEVVCSEDNKIQRRQLLEGYLVEHSSNNLPMQVEDYSEGKSLLEDFLVQPVHP